VRVHDEDEKQYPAALVGGREINKGSMAIISRKREARVRAWWRQSGGEDDDAGKTNTRGTGRQKSREKAHHEAMWTRTPVEGETSLLEKSGGKRDIDRRAAVKARSPKYPGIEKPPGPKLVKLREK